MNGAVLLIGSLLWETEDNSIKEELGKAREEWRRNLLMDQKFEIKVPIRYGRKSSKRMCTYTMIFSNSVQELGTAFIIPFNEKKYVGSDLEILKKQAFELSIAEGISKIKDPEKISTLWGCVGIYFNEATGKDYDELREFWKSLYKGFDNKNYKLGDEIPSITINGELNFRLGIPKDIDYVIASSTIPNISNYPNSKQIINSILETNPRYDIYFLENVKHGIRVFDDTEVLKELVKT